ncbi:outer membrane OprD family porin [Azomonas agilis]|uniref:Outer membrane OprD family porin n=1 Tax=Azomonas agilis TaxID=116849 RepID=A0A562I0Y0_9GAMM|nr:OprD family porin [Azomonas agilis]TWH64486.1 outer membrane OprD family porin [Azomonas agilis]
MKSKACALLVLAELVTPLSFNTARADFIEDSTATLGLRNFYLNQDGRDGAVNRKDWGQAFLLDFKSGYTEGVVGFGLDVLGTYGVRLDGGGRDGKSGIDRTPASGGSFPLESNGKAVRDFGRVGVTGKMRYSKTELHVGTLRPKLPVVIYNDGRLLPQTFEGYQISSKDFDRFVVTAGKLEHSTERTSSHSDSLSIPGSNNRKTGQFSNAFYYGGFDYNLNKDLKLQYYYGRLENFYEQHFLGLLHQWQLPVGRLTTDLRYFDSDSTGKNSTAAGRAEGYRSNGYWGSGSSDRYEVDNKLWSALFTYSLKGHALSAGYQKITGHSDFPSLQPSTGRTLYLITNTNIQGAKFASAGERTWVVGYAYDFAALGIPGLKASTKYYRGDNIDAAGSDAREWARDINLGYEVQEGTLKGLGINWRNGTWRGNDSGTVDRDENRLTLSYNIKLF